MISTQGSLSYENGRMTWEIESNAGSDAPAPVWLYNVMFIRQDTGETGSITLMPHEFGNLLELMVSYCPVSHMDGVRGPAIEETLLEELSKLPDSVNPFLEAVKAA